MFFPKLQSFVLSKKPCLKFQNLDNPWEQSCSVSLDEKKDRKFDCDLSLFTLITKRKIYFLYTFKVTDEIFFGDELTA